MRHRKKTVKLGRSSAHRDALLANQVCSLIEHKRIKTTLAKAKAVRPLAEKLVTLGKRGDLHARRLAAGKLGQKDAVKTLFAEIAPRAATRKGDTPASSSSAVASATPLLWLTLSGLITTPRLPKRQRQFLPKLSKLAKSRA